MNKKEDVCLNTFLKPLQDVAKKIIDSFDILFIIKVIFLATFVLLSINFLPRWFLKRLHLRTFPGECNFILLVVFLLSLFLISLNVMRRFIDYFKRRYKEKSYKRSIAKQQELLLNDKEALRILRMVQRSKSDPMWLSYGNLKVRLLEKAQLITRTTNIIAGTRAPYTLQPLAECKLNQIEKEKNGILSEYYGLFTYGNNEKLFGECGYLIMPIDRFINSDWNTDAELIDEICERDNNVPHTIERIPVIFNNKNDSKKNVYLYGEIKIVSGPNSVDNMIRLTCRILGMVPLEKVNKHREELLIDDGELDEVHFALKKVNAVDILDLKYDGH